MATVAEIKRAFEGTIEPDAPPEAVELFNRRMAWVEDAVEELGIEGDPPGETVKALIDAAIRLLPEDEKPAPKRRRPRVSTPKDKPRPRYAPPEKRKRPTHVVHRDAQPTEAQLRMVDKLIEQKGADAFLAACVDVEIQAHTTIRDRMTKWTRYQVSQLIKALLAS